MTAFQGKPPGGGGGEMSRRTERLRKRIGNEPIWKTVDRLVGKLLQLRKEKAAGEARRDRGGQRSPTQSSRMPLF